MYCAETEWSLFVWGEQAGVSGMPSPMQPEFAGFIHAEHVEKILSVMSEAFNYVIVDTPTYLHDTAVPALAEAREIIVVTTLDLAAIQNMKQCIDPVSYTHLDVYKRQIPA